MKFKKDPRYGLRPEWHVVIDNLIIEGGDLSSSIAIATTGNITTTGIMGVGTATPDASAQLDVSSTKKGLLPPRMTTAQKNAIASPAEGLLVIDTNLDRLQVYIGAAWHSLVRLDGDTMTGILNMGSHSVTNVTDPSSAQDAATKAYVDAIATGLSPKQSVAVATTTTLPTNVYANGSSGVGATLTGVSTGVLTIDGYTVALNDRILVKDEAAGANNGIYKCTVAGAVGVLYVLTRATDADTSAELMGAYTLVENGTVNADAGFVNSNTGTITFGSTSITFVQFSGAGEISAGNGLSKAANTISIIGAASPDASSLIDLASTTKGSRLVPQMTTTQKNAISSPAVGLEVYDNILGKPQQYDGANWRTVAYNGDLGLAMVSGNYYAGDEIIAYSASAMSANTIYAVKKTVYKAGGITRVGINVTTSINNALVKFGVWKDLNGQPGALVAGIDQTAITLSGVGAQTAEFTVSVTLAPGIYWLGIVSDSAISISFSSTSTYGGNQMGYPSYSTGRPYLRIQKAFTLTNSGTALPDPFGTPTYSQNGAPLVMILAA